MLDLISVIVPIYNVENYLDRCVQSIVNQTYINLEIILVDDGSTDACASKCDMWARIDGRIKTVHKKNGGLSDARNVGIEAANGKFIGFVDSDDFIDKLMYEKLYLRMNETKAELGICNYEYVDNDGITIKKDNIIKNCILQREEAFLKLTEDSDFYYVTAVNKLYCAKIFENIKFPLGKLHEDEFTIHYIFSRCNKIVTVQDHLYKYVQRENSIMNSKYTIKRLDGMDARLDRYMFFKSLGLNDIAKKTLIQSYTPLINCIMKVDFIENKKDLKKAIHKLIKYLKLNPRSFKLIIYYCKRSFSVRLNSKFQFKT